MSRVGKNPIKVPSGIQVSIAGNKVEVKGSLGVLSREISDVVKVTQQDGVITVVPLNDSRQARALYGTTRAVIANMVTGVSSGFEKKLTLVGVGYRAQAQGDKLNLSLGFSHPVVHQMPVGIKVETPQQTEVLIKGVDKQLVGQVAADVRGYRPPEPYKGKGVRYADERVVMKETKKK
ncbi:MAG: 50S ribosomal protein L6 [Proteobacteria bacterium]|nr:50S ribosomal protein L6 [Pseudomonadota bacterium]